MYGFRDTTYTTDGAVRYHTTASPAVLEGTVAQGEMALGPVGTTDSLVPDHGEAGG